MREIIGSGAEATIYKEDDSVVKDRVEKDYRLKEIDDKLRGTRTRREGKVLEKLEALNFPAPRLRYNDRKSILRMDFIKGEKVRDIFEKGDIKKISNEIGKKVAMMHNATIIHGDLTTSNMIMGDEIYFIDFGLSFFSQKEEDMAVDLHLLRQALESKHHTIWEESFDEIIKAYEKESNNGAAILKRFEVVEQRGRNKNKH